MNAYWKSILAALAAGIASLVTGLEDGKLTPAEWLIALGAVLVGLGVVAAVPNAGFVNLNKVTEDQLQEAGAAAREVYQERLSDSTGTDRGSWTNTARAVVLSLRR